MGNAVNNPAVSVIVEEYKLLQAKTDKVGDSRFLVNGWSVTVVFGLLLGSAASDAPPFTTLLVIPVLLLFALVELRQQTLMNGPDDWRSEVFHGGDALSKKIRQIAGRAKALDQNWMRFQPRYRRKYLDRILRDLQRFELLQHREVIPPTPMLRRRWGDLHHPREAAARLAKETAALPDRVRSALLDFAESADG